VSWFWHLGPTKVKMGWMLIGSQEPEPASHFSPMRPITGRISGGEVPGSPLGSRDDDKVVASVIRWIAKEGNKGAAGGHSLFVPVEAAGNGARKDDAVVQHPPQIFQTPQINVRGTVTF
jgi:hypothetical protein